MRLRPGYSFPEVLFAVVVLGIGFIMIAAIFPVAISQSKLTSDETTAAAVSRGAVSTLSRIADTTQTAPASPTVMPATTTGNVQTVGDVVPFDRPEGWGAIKGSLIFRQDPRYAFVPLYRRDGNTTAAPPVPWAGSAQLFVIAVQVRGTNPPRTALEFNDVRDVNVGVTPGLGNNTPITNTNNLYPHQIRITRMTDNYNSTGVDVMEVDKQTDATVGINTENFPKALAEGTYVIMRQPHPVTRRFYIYRVGTARPDIAVTSDGYPAAWELMPGSDMQDATEAPAAGTVSAWCVGRERLANGEFTGPTQDISVFTTFVKCNP